MRKDLLENDFSFRLTRTEDPRQKGFACKGTGEKLDSGEGGAEASKEGLGKSAIGKTNLENVFQEVVGNTLLKRENQSFADSFLQTEDYQLSLTQVPREEKK